MRVLVVGGGGREHALVWAMSKSPKVSKIFCSPGNAGIARMAECIDTGDGGVVGLADWAAQNRIDLTVVGPEAPLVAGIVDEFRRRRLPIFGPTKWAAQIEGSKLFAKRLMDRCGVPTAGWRAFSDFDQARRFIRSQQAPYVIKADGLAAGKGVTVASSPDEAEEAVREMMVGGKFGEAGRTVILEEFMEGREASVLAFCDGQNFVLMPPAQDHKRLLDGDKGPNTGGMGAYSPVPFIDDRMMKEIAERIFRPILDGMRQMGHPYTGVLYAGLMLTADGPKVVEFNCRFGDPEAQAVIPRLESDLYEILAASVSAGLGDVSPAWKSDGCVAVVMASGGYPETYRTGYPIQGLDEAGRVPGVTVFHSATAGDSRSGLVTAGGRVLTVSALGRDLKQALERAYEAAGSIRFEGAFYRRDIAQKAFQ